MKKSLYFLLFAIRSVAVFGQQSVPIVPPNATIERVDLSGMDENKLSPELRADIQRLAGQPYNPQAIEALTQDIQVEFPEYVAAATTQPGSQPDRVRLVLLVAKIADNDALKNNINSRYIVDAVEFEGDKARISDALNADLQSMVGGNVNTDQLGKFAERIRADNPSLMVSWKLRRSSAPQHVNVVYEVRKTRNTLTFNVANGTYHSRQGFGGEIWGLRYTNVPFGTLSFSMLNTTEELIERYAGYRAGYSFQFGHPRFRFGVEYSSFRSQWKTNTLEADSLSPQSPGLYRLRDTLSGYVDVRGSLNQFMLLGASARVEFTELDMQSPSVSFQKSNVLKGSVYSSYTRHTDIEGLEWRSSYEGAAGAAAIDSDYVYSRHEVKSELSYSRRSHGIEANFLAGRIGGRAPMYERFSIGNARTLRGWNKYEINPLGGDRVVYGSGGYRYKILTGFYDVGSVWNSDESGKVRQSAGFRLGKARCRNILALPHPECFSMTVGFPIHGGDARPSFILGMGI